MYISYFMQYMILHFQYDVQTIELYRFHFKQIIVPQFTQGIMKRLLFLLASVPLLFALKSSLAFVPEQTEVMADTLCFSRDILPIFNSNCAMAKCHDAITHEEGYTLTSYSGIMKGIRAGNPNQSKLYREINENAMPPDRVLPDSLKKRISAWIEQGALNNDCPTNDCDTLNITLQKTIKPLIAVQCLGCHSGNSPSAGISFENDEQIEGMKEIIACAVMHGQDCKPMPPNNVSLNQCIKAKFRIWGLGTQSSVEETTQNDRIRIIVSPNHEELYCIIQAPTIGSTKIEIVSLQGVVVRTVNFSEKLDLPFSIYIGDIPKGMYMVKLSNTSGTFMAKFVK